MPKRHKMCRTREEIIQSRSDLQDLKFQIERLENKIEKEENGENLLNLREARVALNSAILQIQMEEDMHLKLDSAKEERRNLSGKIDKVEGKLDNHIKDNKENPTLKKALADNPLKVIGSILGLALPIMVSVYLLLFSILYASGWEVIIKTFLNKILGL